MCNLDVKPVAQRDPRWRDMMLGDQRFGPYGCLVTSLGMTVGELPSTFLPKLIAAGALGYVNCRACVNTFNIANVLPGFPRLTNITSSYPNVPFPDVQISETILAIKRGQPVVLEVDMNSNVPGEQMHFVLAVGVFGNGRIIINDPWYEDQALLVDRYGSNNGYAIVRAITYERFIK